MSPTYVNFDEIEEYCNSMQEIAKKMLASFEEIGNLIKGLPNFWVGEAAKSYVNEINKLMENFEPAHRELILSILFLASVGEGYDNLSNSSAEELKALAANSPLAFGATVSSSSPLPEFSSTEKSTADEILDHLTNPTVSDTSEESIETETTEEIEEKPLEETDDQKDETPDEQVDQHKQNATEQPKETGQTQTPQPSYQNTREDLTEQLNQNKQNAAEQPKENQVEVLDLSDDRKSVEEVAREVIYGKFGNGTERIEKLEAAGYDPNEVQAKVNELMRG